MVTLQQLESERQATEEAYESFRKHYSTSGQMRRISPVPLGQFQGKLQLLDRLIQVAKEREMAEGGDDGNTN